MSGVRQTVCKINGKTIRSIIDNSDEGRHVASDSMEVCTKGFHALEVQNKIYSREISATKQCQGKYSSINTIKIV